MFPAKFVLFPHHVPLLFRTQQSTRLIDYNATLFVFIFDTKWFQCEREILTTQRDFATGNHRIIELRQHTAQHG
jgi:hypothetical protein